MASERRGIGNIRTMSRIVDARKIRTPATAFLEMSALAYERDLLMRELERWKRRHQEIMTRLAELDEKEARLREITGGSSREAPASCAGQRATQPPKQQGIPIVPDPSFDLLGDGQKIVGKEFDY